jgi:hypothetical protein
MTHTTKLSLFNSQHVSARIGRHQVILRNTQHVTDYINYSVSVEFAGQPRVCRLSNKFHASIVLHVIRHQLCVLQDCDGNISFPIVRPRIQSEKETLQKQSRASVILIFLHLL